MAIARVPARDAERGDLPMICVISGKPTTSKGLFEQEPRRKRRVAWWFVLGMMPGLIQMAFREKTRRGDVFHVNLPVTREVWEHISRLRKRADVGVVVMCLLALGSVAALTLGALGGAGFYVAAVLAVAAVSAGIVTAMAQGRTRAIYPVATS